MSIGRADTKLAMHSSGLLPEISQLQYLGLPSAGFFIPTAWRVPQHGKGWIPCAIHAMIQAGHQQGKVQWAVCTTQAAILPQTPDEMEKQLGSDSKQQCLLYLSQNQHKRLMGERENSDVQ